MYPGTVMFEGSNLSEGRGTERPFEWIGAPWIDAAAWAAWLNTAGVPGIRFTELFPRMEAVAPFDNWPRRA